MYLSRGFNCFGFLNAERRDLAGWSAIANELIQVDGDAARDIRPPLEVRVDAEQFGERAWLGHRDR